MYTPPMGKIFEIPDADDLTKFSRYVVSIDPHESLIEKKIIVLHELFIGKKKFDFEVQYGERIMSFKMRPMRFPLEIFTAKEINPIDQMPHEKVEEMKIARAVAERENYYFDPYR